jgi:excisionase family DNA binding protein
MKDQTKHPPLTSVEASEKLGIDRSTLTRWVADGRISALKKLPGVRGAYLFAPAEIARLKEADSESQ